MPILYRVGDLLDADQRCIAHGVNTSGIMGAGVARLIREAYPEVFLKYREDFKNQKLNLGSLRFCETEEKLGDGNSRVVVNMVTQHLGREPVLGCGMPVSYDAIQACFRELEKHATDLSNGLEVGIPKIGSGLGGGSWDVIHAILEKIATSKSKLTLIVYVTSKTEIPFYGTRWVPSSGKYRVRINSRVYYGDTKKDIDEILSDFSHGLGDLVEVETVEGECDLGNEYISF